MLQEDMISRRLALYYRNLPEKVLKVILEFVISKCQRRFLVTVITVYVTNQLSAPTATKELSLP